MFRPFFSKLNYTDFVSKIPKDLDVKKLKSAADLLNKKKFPIDRLKRTELTKLLSPYLTEDDVEFLLSPLNAMLAMADDYDMFLEVITTAISDIKNETLRKNTLNFVKSLNHIKGYFVNSRLKELKARAKIYFRDIEYSCSLTGRFEKDYNYKEMSIEDYSPNIHDVVPMVSLSFETSDSNNDNFSNFVVDEDNLDEIISTLLAAQKELNILKSTYKAKKNG